MKDIAKRTITADDVTYEVQVNPPAILVKDNSNGEVLHAVTYPPDVATFWNKIKEITPQGASSIVTGHVAKALFDCGDSLRGAPTEKEEVAEKEVPSTVQGQGVGASGQDFSGNGASLSGLGLSDTK